MAEKAVKLEDFSPEEHKSVEAWMDNEHDWNPSSLFQAIGYSPGHGGHRSRQDLEPGFLDELGGMFGIQTDKMKERSELAQKQKELMPFVQGLMQIKAHRLEELRKLPKTSDEAQAVMNTLQISPGGGPGLQAPPGMHSPMQAEAGLPMGAPGQAAAANGLQPAPGGLVPAQNLSPTLDGAPQMMRRPGEAPADIMQAQFPLGTPGMLGAMDQTGQLLNAPVPDRGQQVASMEMSAPIPGQAPQEQIVSPEMMQVADRKVLQAPPVPPAPRKLKEWERHQVGAMLHSQAVGGQVLDETGTKLVPASFAHPDSRLLSADQQTELSNIYRGEPGTGSVKLPSAPFMAALKGKQEGKAQDLSQGVREYMKAHDMADTPANIKIARTAVANEKDTAEKSQIEFKEALQAGSAKVKDFLYSKTGQTLLSKATPAQVEQAIKDAADQEVSVHARNIMNQFNLGGLDATEKEKLVGLQQVASVTHRLKTEFTPAERREFVGYLNLPVTRLAQLVKANPRFAQFDALLNREGVAAFDTAGKNLTANESAIIFGFLVQGKEWSPENFEAKLVEGDNYARSKIGDIVTLATTNRKDLANKMESQLPKHEAKKTAAERYNELEGQKIPEADIYNQMVLEGYKVK